jgi:hypothetical protein
MLQTQDSTIYSFPFSLKTPQTMDMTLMFGFARMEQISQTQTVDFTLLQGKVQVTLAI